MGKGKRLKHRKKSKKSFTDAFSDKLSENFQKEIRDSEIWDQMVAEFGEEKAEQILRECKAEVKPGISEE